MMMIAAGIAVLTGLGAGIGIGLATGKATEAIAKGLQPLADYIALQANDSQVAKEAEKYITEEIKTVDEAIENALYIIAENISDDSSIRKWLRSFITHFGFLTSKVKKKNPDEKEVYKMYYE